MLVSLKRLLPVLALWLGMVPCALAQTMDLIGLSTEHITGSDDVFVDLAVRYGVGYVELVAANPGIDPWMPPTNRRLAIPTVHILPPGPRRGILINLAEFRLYYFPDKGPVATFPIGIGSEGQNTPMGTTKIVRKQANPTWYPPPSVRTERPELPASVPPGPDNPMGDRALYLGWDLIRMHGTNRPYGVGRRVSHGCIRLYPEHIRQLFEMVGPGTPVRVMNEPVKLGWWGSELFLEIHPTVNQADEIEQTGRFTPEAMPSLVERIMAAAGAQASRLDWPLIGQAAVERRGMPIRVTR